MPEGYDRVTAVRYLRETDFMLRAHIDAVGPCTLRPAPNVGPHTLFDRLASSILAQQLSVRAAGTITGRLRDLAGDATRHLGRPLDPDLLAALPDEELRACGVSRPKVAALRDLADAVRSGRIPDLGVLRGYDDDEVVAALTTVRGVGRWTAEMQMIFLLDRPDVFPLADVGVRRGLERVLGLEGKATPEQMRECSRSWAPYRSVAAWYLWRAVDQTGQP